MTVYTATDEQARMMRQQRGTWLPVREVIRSAGEFAVSRYGGDNALEAYVTGLTAVGINIPNPEGTQQRWNANFTRVEWFAISLTSDDPTSDGYANRLETAWNNFRRPGMQTVDAVRRIDALAIARGYVQPSVYAGYLDWQGTSTRGTREWFIAINGEYARTIRTETYDRTEVQDAYHAATLPISEAHNRQIVRAAAAAGMTLTRMTDREPQEYNAVRRQERGTALNTRVSEAATRADEIAGPNEFLPTDEFLSMMRDQAISNHWCPEHHTIINRLTRQEREPFGVRASVSFTLRQEFTTDLTSFYGGDGTPDAIRNRIRQQLQYAQDIAGQGTRARFTVNEHTADVQIVRCDDNYVRPAEHITAAELIAGPDTGSITAVLDTSAYYGTDDTDDEIGEYCDECDEYHDMS